ncbi:MAG TPA: hypothetical protein VMP01_12400 [Pirellulaceae bacterium]|nr:hypothetical protein [Pirellulaceae bacterium]
MRPRASRPSRCRPACGSAVRSIAAIGRRSDGGQEGIAPLENRLGIVAGGATPALADEAARWQADMPQQQTRTVLRQRVNKRDLWRDH